MPSGIAFLRKNRLDLDNSVNISATEANDFINFVRNRSVNSAWITTGSQDSNLTQIDIDILDPYAINFIILADHNFKAYTIEYYNGSSWVLKETVTNNELTTTFHEFTSDVSANQWRIIIQGTMVADADKRLGRLILSDKIGRFTYSPVIKNPVHDKGKIINKMLSGKRAISRNVGAFKFTLSIKHLRQEQDLALIENLYSQFYGFEVWLGGGDETQFFYAAEGYRLKDIYLMQPADDWKPELIKGIYTNGIEFNMDLIEVVK